MKLVLEDTAFYRIKSVGTFFFISFEKCRISPYKITEPLHELSLVDSCV